MTMIFSGATSCLIVMSVDSVERKDYGDGPAYDNDVRKSYIYEGVGCVTTWGARDGNRIGFFLEEQLISPQNHSVVELARLVEHYLKNEFKPQEIGLHDVGYHIGGFDRDSTPRLFHTFWLASGSQYLQPGESEKYGWQDRPIPSLLYNGRSELAHTVVTTLLQQIREGKPVNFDLEDPADLASFGDLIARFAAEITEDVGPPFYTMLISPTNQIFQLPNKEYCPISKDEVVKALLQLGITDNDTAAPSSAN